MQLQIQPNGFGLVEVVVASGLVSLALVGLMSTATLSYQINSDNTNELRSSFLLEEGLEAVKSMRDKSWQAHLAALTPGTNYYFVYTSGAYNKWGLTTINVLVDGVFTRSLQVSDVYRNGSDDIAASGTLDPKIKKVAVTVSWPSRGTTKTKSISTYLTNLFNN